MLEYTVPSRCALEYLNFSANMYQLICFVETVIMILATTANLGNDYLIFYRYFVFYSVLLQKKQEFFFLKYITTMYKDFY